MVAMKPVVAIGNIRPSPKDLRSPDDKCCVVYLFPCRDCVFVHIGQTKRDLKSRLAEHQRSIKLKQPEKSALCEHSSIWTT